MKRTAGERMRSSSSGSSMAADEAVPRLPHPRATLLIPDGGVIATRVHYETLNDAMFLLRAAALASVLCLATVVLLSLATANVDIKLGFLAIMSYPRLLFSSAVWTSTSVFSAILVAWFVVFCIFCHIIRLHFNTTDPPRDWDDRNGEWSVVELDVRAGAKASQPAAVGARHAGGLLARARVPGAAGPPSSDASSCCDTEAVLDVPHADQWKLGVLPASRTKGIAPYTQIALLTPDRDFIAWRAGLGPVPC
ncbi:hypothetical protein IWQ56_003142 [Coemansia nantahalensis]|nr:hypothetical protein IWQ56_003142 [Coemansia nantahalensis]